MLGNCGAGWLLVNAVALVIPFSFLKKLILCFETQSPYTVQSGHKPVVLLHQPPKYGAIGMNGLPWLAGIYDSFLNDISRHGLGLLYVYG